MRRKLSAITAAFIAFATLQGCDLMQGRESAGQYGDDASISTKVRAKLIEDQVLKAFDIHVDTLKGVVQLSGFVDSATQKRQAEQIARNVAGVTSVKNDLVARANS